MELRIERDMHYLPCHADIALVLSECGHKHARGGRNRLGVNPSWVYLASCRIVPFLSQGWTSGRAMNRLPVVDGGTVNVRRQYGDPARPRCGLRELQGGADDLRGLIERRSGAQMVLGREPQRVTVTLIVRP